MSSPFERLNEAPVDIESSPEIREIMWQADGVVSRFFHCLDGRGDERPTGYPSGMFLSSDLVELGAASEVEALKTEAELDKVGCVTITFEDGVSAIGVSRALAFQGDEMRVALMVIVINLRQIDYEGATLKSNRRLDASVARFRAMLEYALRAV